MFGPTLRGKLGMLRRPRVEEARLMAAWFESVEVTQFLTLTRPPSIKQEEEWLESRARDASCIVWAIEFDRQLVGVSSIEAIDWINQHGTTGTVIGPKSAWRKGLATEMMQLRTEYAFTQTTLRKLKSGYLGDNYGSAKAQEKAGYKIVGVQRQEYFRNGHWIDHVVTEILREDWAKGRLFVSTLSVPKSGDFQRPFGHDEGEGLL